MLWTYINCDYADRERNGLTMSGIHAHGAQGFDITWEDTDPGSPTFGLRLRDEISTAGSACRHAIRNLG